MYVCMYICMYGHVFGERAKRARRYLVMFMETRDIYIYIYIYVRLFLIPMRSFSLGYADPPSVLACAC